MRLNKLFAAVLIAAGVASPSIGQACQWVRVGELSDRLECRSNYRNFIGDNAELFNKLLMESAYLALGSADKITIDNWAIRNAVTIPEAHELIGNRFEADKLINEMNAIIRQEGTLDSNLDLLQLPSAIMFGITVPFNGDVTKIPFLPKMIKEFMPNPGGSLFIGLAFVPQKVEFVMNADGTLAGPEEYVTRRKEDKPSEYADALSTLLAPANDESVLYDYNRVRLDARWVVIPSVDAKTGQEGAYKSSYAKPTMGFVFGDNIVKSHQLLGHGPSATVPAKSLRSLRHISYLGPAVLPNWLLRPVERFVDTVKVGFTFAPQDEHGPIKKDELVNFSENVFVWLRFHDRLKRVAQAEQDAAVAETVKNVIEGKFHLGWFGVMAAFNDGEANTMLNGLSGDMLSAVGGSIAGVAKDILGRSQEILSAEGLKSAKEQIDQLKESLEADNARAEDDAEKLSPAVRAVIEEKIKELEAQIKATEEAAKKDKK